MTSKESLRVEQLTKVYGHGETAVTAVDDVSLTLNEGDFIAILGPSGSGKTTLLSMIGGLLHATAGSITVSGEEITRLAEGQLARFRRQNIGFVFQNYNLIPYLDAMGNLLVVSHINKMLNVETRERAARLIAELGLEKRADHLPEALSGGERQRVAIARALMNDPVLILVDEPTANLDTKRGEQVVKMLRDQVKSRGKSGIMVTHDERMCRFADKTVALLDGRLIAEVKILR